jgi:replicative DNA helicase
VGLDVLADTEKAFIGAILQQPKHLAVVGKTLKPEDFSTNTGRTAYTVALELFKAGDKRVDLLTVSQKMPRGGMAFGWLAEASDSCTSPRMAVNYAEIIAKNGKRSRLVSKIKQLAAAPPDADPDSILSALLDLHRTESGGPTKPADVINIIGRFNEITEANAESDYGYTTGFKFFDRKYVRYLPGHLWVIGAFTSVGKTATMIELVKRSFTDKPKVAIVSTEMSEEQNVARILASATGFNSQVILSGSIQANLRPGLEAAKGWLAEQNLLIYDDLFEYPGIEMELHRIKQSTGLDIAFIDFIQNMTHPGTDSEYQEMRLIAKKLQRLAKKLRCCIVVLSQIPNSAAKDDAGILEFKGAGDIAAACDLGILLKRSNEVKERILLDVRKNRHGPLMKQALRYQNHWTSLEEEDHEENE